MHEHAPAPHQRQTRRRPRTNSTHKHHAAALAGFTDETKLPDAIYGGSSVQLTVHELPPAELPARVTVRSVVAVVPTTLKLLTSVDGTERWSVAGMIEVGPSVPAQVSAVLVHPYWRAVLLNDGSQECRRISVAYRVEPRTAPPTP